MQEATPALPAGWSLAPEEQIIASCATSESGRLWLTNRRLIYAEDRNRGEGVVRTVRIRDVADVAYAHFERRWLSACAWILAALWVAWCAFIVLSLLQTLWGRIERQWLAMLLSAIAIAIALRTARRYYVTVRVAGRGRPWIVHDARAHARQVGEFAALVSTAVASR